MSRSVQRVAVAGVAWLLAVAIGFAGVEQAGQKSARKKRAAKNSPLRQVSDDPTLPRVLLIGDSISIGYTLPLRESLKGLANVHRPATNCGPTTRGLEQIDRWLGQKPWDVIHFNWGLHDLKYLGADGKSLGDPKSPTSRQQVPIEQYEKNLRLLVARLKKTGATLIWRSTTPVPPGARGRVVGDAVKYNAVAASVMKESRIAIDDMYAFAKTRLKQIQRPANVHFSRDGSKALADHAAGIIRKSIDPRTGLRTTVREVISLLQKKDYSTAIRTIARPDELAQILKQRSFEQLLERFSMRKAEPLLEILSSIKDTKPKLGPAGRVATYALPKPVGSQKSIVFEKVGRFWYIAN